MQKIVMLPKQKKNMVEEHKKLAKDIAMGLKNGVANKASSVSQEIRNHATTAIASAFAFIIALVWRDTIQKIIDSFVVRLSIPQTAYLHEVIVAMVITVVCVIGILVTSKHSVKKQ